MNTTMETEHDNDIDFEITKLSDRITERHVNTIRSFRASSSVSLLSRRAPLSVSASYPDLSFKIADYISDDALEIGALEIIRQLKRIWREIEEFCSRKVNLAKVIAAPKATYRYPKPSRTYTIYGKTGVARPDTGVAYDWPSSSQAELDAFTNEPRQLLGLRDMPRKGPKHLQKHLPVLLNGNQVSAIADRGCGSNLISMKLAMELGIKVKPDVSCPTFRLPISNRKIKPLGRASVFVQFPGEPDTRKPFEFFVCHNLDTPLILGRKFLKATETQTKFKHRLKDAIGNGLKNHLPSLFSISEEDETQERLLCHIDGSPFLARPDTGSAINVMSLLFARQAGYAIDTLDRKLIRLGDGSIHSTFGTTHALVSLGNGSEPAEAVEFDIVDQLDVPIILGEQLLLEHDAFDQYAEYFVEVDSDYLDFGSIVLIGKIEEAMRSLKAKGKAFMRIGKTKPAIVVSEVDELEARDNKEYHRRRREDARIAKLDGVERQRAVDAESWRREQYLRHRNGGKPAPVCSVANSRVSSTPSSTSKPSAGCSNDIVRDLSEEAASYIALCA